MEMNISQNSSEHGGHNTTDCNQPDTCWHTTDFALLFFALYFADTLLVILANGVTLFILVRNELLETSSNVLIACLTMADMLYAASVPFRISEEYSPPGPGWSVSCFCLLLISQTSSTVNIVSIFLIAVDRLVFFVRSLEYHALVPVHLVCRLVYCIWGLSFIFNLAVLGAGYNHYTPADTNPPSCLGIYSMTGAAGVVYALPYLVLVPATICIYIKIGFVAWKQRRSIAAAPSPPQTPPEAGDFKIAKVMLMVLVVYVGCNLVVVLLPVLRQHLPAHLHPLAVQVCYFVWRINRWVNPFIYAGRSTKFRRYLKKLFTPGGVSAEQAATLF